MRTIWMMTTVLLFAAMVFALSSVLYAQKAELYDALFGEKDKKLKEYKSQMAEFLAPTFYADAVDKYAKIKDDFNKGREVSEIRKKLTEIEDVFKKIEMTLWTGRNLFKEVLKAREDALNANAPEFSPAEFNAADDLLRSAGKEEEIGNADGVREKAAKATQRYRDSELNAIKKSVITPAREALTAAKKAEADKLAPKTYEKAKTLLQVAEQILINDRYNVTEATAKAEQAIYEANHAIQINNFLRNKKYSSEELALFYEEHFGKIARELGYEARFDQEFDKSIQQLITSISNLKEEKKNLTQDLADKEKELEQKQHAFEETLAKYKQQLSSLMATSQQREAEIAEELARKQKELQEKQEREAKIAKVREMFTPAEASVLLEADRLIIRLFSLSFPVGKATIGPEYFNILSRVQRALREYPESTITIEGHTDAIGDERYNERLSTKRAEAVREYLIANMAIDASRIEAIGYGESRPIASNETEEGRAQNRRIDISIKIE